MTERVVTNASPFILLSKAGLIDLLPALFNEILMPESVWEEIAQTIDIARENLFSFEKKWIRSACPIVDEVRIWNLGDGETEVLSLTLLNKHSHTALIDDRAARRCADTLEIRTLGTGGILILAKNRDLISNVKVELDKLIRVGLYISGDVRSAILKQADESA